MAGRPEAVGTPEEEPAIAEVEPARLLANDARPRLAEHGLTDDEIDAWAKTYVVDVTKSATVDEFVSWVTHQLSADGPRRSRSR
jgi:hypothetical protein